MLWWHRRHLPRRIGTRKPCLGNSLCKNALQPVHAVHVFKILLFTQHESTRLWETASLNNLNLIKLKVQSVQSVHWLLKILESNRFISNTSVDFRGCDLVHGCGTRPGEQDNDSAPMITFTKAPCGKKKKKNTDLVCFGCL